MKNSCHPEFLEGLIFPLFLSNTEHICRNALCRKGLTIHGKVVDSRLITEKHGRLHNACCGKGSYSVYFHEKMKNRYEICSPRITDMMFRLARTLLGRYDEAEDAVNDTIEKLWRRQHWNEIVNPEAFAISAVRNTCIDRIRSRKETTDRVPDTVHESETDSRSDIEMVRKALEKLPERQKWAVHMKDIEGFSTREISEMSGIPENHIRTILSRARKRLKEIIEEDMRYGL